MHQRARLEAAPYQAEGLLDTPSGLHDDVRHHCIVDAVMDIVVWLRSLGLGKYEAAFRENEIDARRPRCRGGHRARAAPSRWSLCR
jgi:hypothetical protein